MIDSPQTNPDPGGNRFAALAFLGAGLLMSVMGLLFLLFGSIRLYTRPPAKTDQPAPTTVAEPVQSEGWKLVNSTDGGWLARSADGSDEVKLPEFLPRPPLFQPPERVMQAREIGLILVQAMERNRYSISKEEYFQLQRLKLGNAPVFEEPDRLATLVPGEGVSRKEQKKFEKAQETQSPAKTELQAKGLTVKPSPEPEKSPSQAKPGFPDQFNPNSSLFTENMRAWKTEIMEELSSASPGRRGYPVAWSYNGKPVKLDISANTRSRILSDGWATASRDKLIWLQVLINTGPENLLVDGKFGGNSKAALSRWLHTVLDKKQAEAADQAVQEFLSR